LQEGQISHASSKVQSLARVGTASLPAVAAAAGRVRRDPALVHLVFVHGTALTPAGSAQALAGWPAARIVAVGSDADTEAMAAAKCPEG